MTVRKKVKTVTPFILTIKKPLLLISLGAIIKLLFINLVVPQILEINDHKQYYKHMHK